MRILDGKILIVGDKVAMADDCCCNIIPCCGCSEFSDIPAIGGVSGFFQDVTPATLDLTLSTYNFCTTDNITLTFRVRNTTGAGLGMASISVIVGNLFKFDPTDVITPGRYNATGSTPAWTSITLEPGSVSGCAGQRITIAFPPEDLVVGFDKTHTVDFTLEAARIFGLHASTPAGFHGLIAGASTRKHITLDEISCVACY